MGKPQERRYSPIAQALHWLIALLIVVQFVLARIAAPLPLGTRKLALLAEHKSFGMTVLMLAVIRFAWRLKNQPPSLPTNLRRAERFLARFSHVSFYILLVAMPLSGWLMSSAKNYSVSWFGAFSWPNLIAPSETAFNFFRTLHHLIEQRTVRDRRSAHSCGAEASLLEQGRCSRSNASRLSIGEQIVMNG